MCLRPYAALKEADSARCRGNPTTRTPFFRSFLSREVKASGTASRVAGRRLARCLQKNEKTYRQTDGTHPLEERRAAAHRSNLLLNHHILPRQTKFVNGFFCFFENFFKTGRQGAARDERDGKGKRQIAEQEKIWCDHLCKISNSRLNMLLSLCRIFCYNKRWLSSLCATARNRRCESRCEGGISC